MVEEKVRKVHTDKNQGEIYKVRTGLCCEVECSLWTVEVLGREQREEGRLAGLRQQVPHSHVPCPLHH